MTEQAGSEIEGGVAEVPFRDAIMVWLKIGLLSFGGPAGQIAMMHRVLVDEKRWIGEARYLHALNYCMLLPGPEAQQLATYVGWLLHRTLGGLVAGILFILPGAFVMLALSIVYALYSDLPLINALFFGIKAAVLAIVVEAVLRIGRRALGNHAMYAIAALAFVSIFFFSVPFPLIVVGAALIGFLGAQFDPDRFVVIHGHGGSDAEAVADAALASGRFDHTRPSLAQAIRVIAICLPLWFGPTVLALLMLGGEDAFTQIGWFFSKLAVVTFGGAYAVLAYMAQQAVEAYGWLAPGEMLDGLGLAETTPGPLIMVVQFVGYLAAFRNSGVLDPLTAGVIGAALATWVTFVPCFLWIFLGAPHIEKLRDNTNLSAALSGITAAVVGVVLNLAVWFGMHVVFKEVGTLELGVFTLPLPVVASTDFAALGLSLFAIWLTFGKHLGLFVTLGLTAAAGILISFIPL
ncbi:MAG: chromate transporter [Alphaproteobacteria bacterium]|nr:chromate transporter [Alphaproteobacteria bacterium]|tara:strand:- start:1112 stop:2497 length:1386 start_codon:yes stop_codon:yes gene_type:complete